MHLNYEIKFQDSEREALRSLSGDESVPKGVRVQLELDPKITIELFAIMQKLENKIGKSIKDLIKVQFIEDIS